MSASPAVRADRTWLVALAASLWGLSSLWRDPLAQRYPSLAVVFWEHLVLVALTLPWLVPALGRVARASVRTRVSVLVIGAGSSALATTLFTAAFRYGDPITPQVLQKLQPVIAVALAAALLGERLRRSYLWFAVPALVGAWLLAFPDPLGVSVATAQAALLAVGAAALWAAGTVFGRAASAELRFADLTALRFGVGLVTLTVIAGVTSTPLGLGRDAALDILLLALVPGLLALVLYYRALGRTPASRATLAELAFPLSAAVVGVVALGARPTGSQWLGLVVVLAAVVGLALHEQRSRRPAVVAPVRAEEALAGAR
ncbi:EamA family transporter [Phycicoccus endophyticus]|uniref:EamA family transporter n=1 Tax=Phycicoccus endophyticus TaxID=1690220 RepID=A0A7G9R2Q3_9MICO|nr:EamA family transporter [Phycicoccus endophyticus]NHI20345.1 EamA family transporter [Phycicoccus endophyticus]QNN49878.1 EamA family transporter [Phycicoccus endophyticus]GGL29965.1 EamA family transporter [Phycicoccus endophyticus]